MIDDDPDMVRILRYVLRDAGYSVVYAHNGADGIEKAKAEKPDMVLTDLAMPGMSGVEVIDALHNDPDTRGIPILAVTAYAWDTLGQVARRAGCVGHVSKPFTTEQLLRHIERHLRASADATDAPPVAAPLTGDLRLRAG